MTDQPDPGEQPSRARRPLAVLLDRTLGTYLMAKMMASMGLWIQGVAAAILMYDLTSSSFMVGAVGALQFSGVLVLSFWAGALTDRVDHRRMLMIGRGISGTAMLVLSVPVALDRATPGILLLAMGATGVGLALSSPAMQAIVPSLIPRVDLEQALAFNSAVPNLARTVGPALGAGLLIVGGPGLAFLVAGASHCMFALVVSRLRLPARAHSKERAKALGGLKYAVKDPRAGSLLIGIGMVTFGMDPILTLTPQLAESLGGADELVAIFVAAFGAGAIVMTGMFFYVRRVVSLRHTGVSGFVVVGIGLLVVAASEVIGVAIAGFFVTGIGFMMATVSSTTRIQRRVPDELRGRVMALWGLAYLGSRPLAALFNGFMADTFSLRTAVVIAACISIVSCVFVAVRYGDAGAPESPMRS